MNNKKPPLPNWRKEQIKKIALQVLEAAQIGELPVDIDRILEAHGIPCITMRKAEEFGIRVDGTIDGYTIDRRTKTPRYLIVYNNGYLPRVRWTIAHEIGHIMLGHLDKPIQTEFDIEDEANYFAQELLAPLAVLDELGARASEAISETCYISAQAAEMIARSLKIRDSYSNTSTDIRLLQQFRSMFDVEIALELAA